MTGFFATLKKISILADDTSLTMKHTANILSDDIAVTAEQSSKFRATRELPAIWAITKGSFINKLIILPAMLLLSAYLPSAIIPILVMGGMYLSYEGFEKIHEYTNNKEEEKDDIKTLSTKEIMDSEKENIKSAIITDFILSIEIILIALSSVMDKTLIEQILVVSTVSFLATVGVYGIVALIVRLDDVGLWFANRGNVTTGQFLIKMMSVIIKALGYIGTVAMLLVAGGIFTHNIHYLQNSYFTDVGLLYVLSIVSEILVSFMVGAMLFYIVEAYKRAKKTVSDFECKETFGYKKKICNILNSIKIKMTPYIK